MQKKAAKQAKANFIFRMSLHLPKVTAKSCLIIHRLSFIWQIEIGMG